MTTDLPTGQRRLRADRARQVADVLRRQLVQAEAGSVPTEGQLAEDFGVSRNTVREALAMLSREGLLERIPGTGTVVRSGKYDHDLNRLEGLAETLSGAGHVRNEVRVCSLVPAPAVVARRLGLAPGSEVVYLERRRLADGLPLSLDLTYIAPEVGALLIGEDLEGQDVFALIERTAGQLLGGAEVRLEAVTADAHSAAILEVAPGAPLLMLERLTHLDDGRPVDLEFIRFRGDRISMRGHMPRSAITSTEELS